MNQADAGIRPIVARQTVGAWLDEWLTDYVAPQRRPRTVESYRDTVDRYIRPAIGNLPLAKLQPEDIQRMLHRPGPRGPLSGTTAHYVYAVLRIALGRALKSGRVVRNVAMLVDAPRKSTPEMHPLTAKQARTFLNAVQGDRYGPLYTLAIATGMRQGELFGLRWSDVDLDRGVLTVRHTLQRGTRELAEPKTERARRMLRLGVSAVGVVREQRRRQLEERLAAGRKWADRDLVFTTGTGTALDSQNVTKALQASLRRAGLPHQRFHDLRHAYATLMIEDGEELAVVSRSLGHADLSTTADVYAHLTNRMQERAAARMDSILGATASG
jgi:integrase